MSSETKSGVDPTAASRAAAAETIARVLEEIGVNHPAALTYETSPEGVRVRVVVEHGVSEILCSLSDDGDLMSARLIEL